MNPTAFPVCMPASVVEPRTWQHPGMSLRDYFAAKAMAALMTDGRGTDADVAGLAYQMADAMLKARAEGGAA